MKIKLCPYCGSHNLESSMFCGSCGGGLSANNAVELDESAVHIGFPDTGQNSRVAINTSPNASMPPMSSQVNQTPRGTSSLPAPPPPASSPAMAPPPSYQPTTSPTESGSKTTCSKLAGGCVLAVIVIAAVIAIIAGFSSGSIRDGIQNMFSTFFASLGGGLGIILVLGCSFAPLIFWIWTIIDCVQNEPTAGNDKIVWLLVIFFTNFIGALLYIIIRKPERKRLYGR
jgi:hypothetical protein